MNPDPAVVDHHHQRIEQLLLAFTPFEARPLTDADVARLEVGFLRQAACLEPDAADTRIWWLTDLGLDVLCKNR